MRNLHIIPILFAILFLASVDNQMLIPLLPRMDLGVEVEWLGLLISGYALGAGFFNLFLGPLTDRFGRVIFFRVGLLLFLLAALASYWVPSFSWLLLLRTLTGVTAGLLSTCTASYVGDQFAYEVRGRVMGIVLSSYFAALILGIPAGAAIAQAWGWRSVFLASASLALLLALACLRMPSDRPRPGERPSSPPFPLRVYIGFFRKADTLAAIWVSFCISGATLAFLTYISPFLSAEFGLNPVQISQVFLIAGVAALLGSPAAGWLSDRLTKRSVFLGANTLLALPILAVPALGWGLPFFAAIFLISLAIAFRQTSLQTVQTSLTDAQRRGSFLSLRNGFSQLGIAASVFAAGRLYAWNGYEAVAWLAAGLTLLSSLLFFAAIREGSFTQRRRGAEKGRGESRQE